MAEASMGGRFRSGIAPLPFGCQQMMEYRPGLCPAIHDTIAIVDNWRSYIAERYADTVDSVLVTANPYLDIGNN
jgi:hypothetical protein